MFRFKKRNKNLIVSEKDVGIDPKKQTKPEKLPTVPIIKLFMFATPNDKFLMFCAILCSMVNGLSQPILFLIFGEVIGLFGSFEMNYSTDPIGASKMLRDEVDFLCIMFAVVGAIVAIAAYFQLALWLIIGESQAIRIRNKYYRSILSQDIGWFDSNSSGDVASRISGDINLVQDGISDKVGLLIQYITCCISAFIIAFIKGWKLTLVMLASVPLLTFSGYIIGALIAEDSKNGQGIYGKAGSIAEEVLSSLRTIYSFNSQDHEALRYEMMLKVARKKGFRKAIFSGIGNGTYLIILFLSYALAMWYSGKLIYDGEYGSNNVLIVFFNILSGSTVLGMASPCITAIATAQGAATRLFEIIERESDINPFIVTEENLKNEASITPLKGTVTFQNVCFSYPSRPELKVLKGISFTAEKGQTVALVGSSGSGKSTCIGLLERFYNLNSGGILVDGMDISKISTKFLKEHVGLVGQEPCLFATTIKQNILYGLAKDEELSSDPKELQRRVEEACKLSNIHDFIMKLPNKYETLVGDRGSQLSGGQKQRIAIARAIIKNPTILLLDEATSALDTESEKIVQAALDKASINRTTIVIAHRLSTIRKADKIIVFDRGNIIEQGSHNELLAANGFYANLVKSQEIKVKNEETSSSSTDEAVLEKLSRKDSIKEDAIDFEKDRTFDRHASTESNIMDSSISQEKIEANPIFRVLKMALPWWHLGFLGSFGAFLDGISYPVYAVLLTEATQAFIYLADPELKESALAKINFWSLMFVVLAIGCFIAGFLRYASFNYLGEHVTYEIRRLCFRSLLKQEIGFYDLPENNVGTLTGKLATEAENVQGLIGKVLGPLVNCFSCSIASLIIAFVNGWKLTLVGLAILPLTIYGQLVEINALADVNAKSKKAYLKVSQIAMESIINIRTVSSLKREEVFYEHYLERVNAAHKVARKGFLKSAGGYSLAMSVPHFVNAISFWYGATLVINMEYSYFNMFQINTAIMLLGMSFGFASSELTSFVKSKVAAIEVFKLLDRKPLIDSSDTYGSKNTELKGNVTTEKAHFSYPSRPNVKVLDNLDISVFEGKKVALVGSSGSGKSTIIGLIQRFYKLTSGKLYIEGKDIEEWNVPYLRSNISMVGQEPVLFDLTIAENIAYGAEREVTREEIIKVAKMANAHDFISQMPEGYDSPAGERGGKLSGGQKQRIAIARALIRNPKLLLLDEATSALDSHSEKVVQEALDTAAVGRTTITIAHRLSTIQDADLIIVMKHGKKVEMGTHQELLAMNGYYTELVNSQSLDTI